MPVALTEKVVEPPIRTFVTALVNGYSASLAWAIKTVLVVCCTRLEATQ